MHDARGPTATLSSCGSQRWGVQLYVLVTALGHVLLAMGVGAHAEVHGRSPFRWAPIVLVGGLAGLLWYAVDAPDESRVDDASDAPAANHWGGSTAVVSTPEQLPDERPDWLDERSREKRLADPNSLHIDLPDGTTLTSEDQAAVTAVVEHLEDHPDADADDLCTEVFPDARAGYEYPDVWWTECVHPALEGLPDVDPPPGSDRRRLAIDVRELESHDGQRWVEASDGERSAEFRVTATGIEAASGAAFSRTSMGWMRVAYEAVEEWRDRRNGSFEAEPGSVASEDDGRQPEFDRE